MSSRQALALACPVPPPVRRMRRVLLIAGGLLVAVAGAELALRASGLFPPEPRAWPGENVDSTHPHYEPEATTGWRLKPNVAFTVDGEGGLVHYRADDHGRRVGDGAGPPDGPLVVLAGDSFFHGVGVAHGDSLAGRLTQRFPSIRIENLAQPGFGVDQIVLSVRHQGLPLRPALVIVGIYPNDLSRSHTCYREDLGFHKPTFRLDGGALVPVTAADRPGAFGSWLEHDCRLFGLWRRAWRNLGFRFGTGSWWELNAALLDELRVQVAAAGSRLLLVHVPLHDWRRFGGLEQWCVRHGVPLVDPVQHGARPAGIYFEPAGHLTAAGHRLLTDLVADWIERSGPRLGR